MEIIHKIPILTTFLSCIFFYQIFSRWIEKKSSLHLLWWSLGVLVYGLGTYAESKVGLYGWDEVSFKIWYIFGAIYGGAVLAQGTVYLFYSRKTAHILTIIFLIVSLSASFLTIFSPIDYNAVELYRLTGKVLQWQFIRAFTPIINVYALIFLVGGAFYSAWKYIKKSGSKYRVLSNIYIAVGGLLPGIGGTFTKFGYTEVLYVTEFLGLCLIYYGYLQTRKEAALLNTLASEKSN